MQNIRSLRNSLADLQEQRLFGGWEETLVIEIEIVDGDDHKFKLKEFELLDSWNRKTKETDFETIRSGIVPLPKTLAK